MRVSRRADVFRNVTTLHGEPLAASPCNAGADRRHEEPRRPRCQSRPNPRRCQPTRSSRCSSGKSCGGSNLARTRAGSLTLALVRASQAAVAAPAALAAAVVATAAAASLSGARDRSRGVMLGHGSARGRRCKGWRVRGRVHSLYSSLPVSCVLYFGVYPYHFRSKSRPNRSRPGTIQTGSDRSRAKAIQTASPTDPDRGRSGSVGPRSGSEVIWIYPKAICTGV